jgi:hypothetical protein
VPGFVTARPTGGMVEAIARWAAGAAREVLEPAFARFASGEQVPTEVSGDLETIEELVLPARSGINRQPTTPGCDQRCTADERRYGDASNGGGYNDRQARRVGPCGCVWLGLACHGWRWLASRWWKSEADQHVPERVGRCVPTGSHNVRLGRCVQHRGGSGIGVEILHDGVVGRAATRQVPGQHVLLPEVPSGPGGGEVTRQLGNEYVIDCGVELQEAECRRGPLINRRDFNRSGQPGSRYGDTVNALC